MNTTEWLQQIAPGDRVTRIICGIPMTLLVSSVDEFIHCGPWKFSRRNGAEIDEDLDFNEKITGSFLQWNDDYDRKNSLGLVIPLINEDQS